jgi:quinol-cytochrome oxidoreductase complex cytochrome b subunit
MSPPPVTLLPPEVETEPAAKVADVRHDTPVRGDAAISAGERVWNRAEKIIGLGLPREWNPMANTGALCGFTFLIATVTGVLLLFWYSPSVHTAYESIAAMERQPWGSGMVRTLHRYSSDACVLFAVLHALKIFLARRFTGARWMAWVTGVIALGLIWLDGWLGYWLTWDARAQAVAVGTAQALDALPLFQEPISRSFLANEDINTLIFFVVFFAHMLLPVLIGVVVWIHLVRLKRPKFLPSKGLMIVTTIILVVLSIAIPAALAAPADMEVYPTGFDIDWFYLLPLYLTDRLDGWLLWSVALGGFALVCAVPFLLGRKRKAPARVNQNACNGCTQCYQDCPYEAITMVTIEGKLKPVAQVDPDRCVSCSICVGACDPGAMEFDELDRRKVRDRILGWLQVESGPRDIAFLCADAGGRHVVYDHVTGLSPDLPGWRVVGVPCAAWVHSSFAEMIAKRGGRSVIVACDSDEPRCRHGTELARARAENRREPEFDPSRIPAGSFHFVALDGARKAYIQDVLAGLRGEPGPARARKAAPWKVAVGATLMLVVLSALTVGFSVGPYVAPDYPDAGLVVTFKLAGDEAEEAQEVDTRLDHMRGLKTRTRRLPIRMEVLVDGEVVHAGTYEPRGLRGDSASVGVEELAVVPGVRRVEVRLGHEAEGWQHVDARELRFVEGRRHVVRFEGGFRWPAE